MACGKENITEQQEVIAIEQTMETEEVEEPTEQETETEMFGLDTIEDSSNETISTGTRDDYPDSDPEHQKVWDDFCENWNESDYGTTTKGKVKNDFPYYGLTGYSARNLEDRTTDKGYTVKYDINTGRVYYSGMTLPTGSIWQERESAAVVSQYILDNENINNIYDITYAEFQELLGTYAGD